MHRHHTAIAALTAALVLALGALLAGCGGSTPAPPPDPTPTPSASPSSTPPAMPDAATRHTKAGALAFAKHYIELINYAQATGDVSALEGVEAPECKSCRDARANVTDVYSHGGFIKGGQTTVKRVIDVIRRKDISGYGVDLLITYPEQRVKASSSAQVKHLKGGRLVISIALQPSDSTWRVADWTRAS